MGTQSLQTTTEQLRARIEESVTATRLRQCSPAAVSPADIVVPTEHMSDLRLQQTGDIFAEDQPAAVETSVDVPVMPQVADATMDPHLAVPSPRLDSEDATATAEPPLDNSEQRFSNRKPTVLAGVICNDGSTTMVDIVINDLSANGARFTIDRSKRNSYGAVPKIAEFFHLYATYDRMSVKCKLQWQNGDAFGARYLAAPQFY